MYNKHKLENNEQKIRISFLVEEKNRGGFLLMANFSFSLFSDQRNSRILFPLKVIKWTFEVLIYKTTT